MTAPCYVSFSAFDYCDEKNVVPAIHANLRDGSYYVGEAVIGGKTCKIAIADLNSNGLFNDVEQDLFRGDRFFVNSGAGDRFDQSFPYGKFTRISGQWYSIVASPDGKQTEAVRGVYESRGDDLYICLSGGDEPRPASVRSSPGTKQVSLILKRERP